MAKRNKGKKKAPKQSGSGSMMGMRSGFKSAVGQGKKKTRKKKKPITMVDVLFAGFALSAVLVLIWQLTK